LWEFRKSDKKKYRILPTKSIDDIESSYQKVLLNKKIGENMTIVDNESMKLDFIDCSAPKMIGPKKGQLRFEYIYFFNILGRTKSPWKPLSFLVYKDVSQDSC
jgi:hypothetical protein